MAGYDSTASGFLIELSFLANSGWCFLRITVLVLLLQAGSIQAQISATADWEDIDPEQVEALSAELDELSQSPIRMNNLSRQQLTGLPLNDSTVIVLTAYLKRHPNPQTLNFLDSLEIPAWDKLILRAVLKSTAKLYHTQYRLRINRSAHSNDEKFRQDFTSVYGGWNIHGVLSRDPGAPTFHALIAGGVEKVFRNGQDRIIAGNYTLNLGTGLAFRQAMFGSGSGVSRAFPAVRQSGRIFGSVRRYGYFTGLVWQHEFPRGKVLTFINRESVPGRYFSGEFKPALISQAQDLKYPTGTTLGGAINFQPRAGWHLQVQGGWDQLAGLSAFPNEIDLMGEGRNIKSLIAASWRGGDSLMALAGLKLIGHKISGAVTAWYLPVLRKSRFRLSAALPDADPLNQKGVAFALSVRFPDQWQVDWENFGFQPVYPPNLSETYWQTGEKIQIESRFFRGTLTHRRYSGQNKIYRASVQTPLTPGDDLNIVLLSRATASQGHWGALLGLRWDYLLLPFWRLKGGLVRYRATPFELRLYAYEPDVSGAFSIPLYYGDGLRVYLVSDYTRSDGWQIESKVGMRREFDQSRVITNFDGTLQLSIVL